MVVKKYIKGGLNSDVNQSLMPDGDYLNALNIRTQVGDDGKAGVIRPVPGNTLKSEFIEQYPIQYNIDNRDVKHMVVDEVTGDVYAFISGDIIKPPSGPIPAIVVKPHIAKINTTDGSYEAVLSIDAIEDLWEPVGSNDYLWEDFVQAKIIGGVLTWINRDGLQFSFNITAALNNDSSLPSYYGSGYSIRDISLIKAPPVYKIVGNKDTLGSTKKNFIKDNVFQFAYRYTYNGYEQSVVSPWSDEFALNDEDDLFNIIRLSIPFDEKIPNSVISVEVISKNNITGGLNIIKKWDRLDENDASEIGLHNIQDTQLNFIFYNDQIYESVDLAYFTKQFDSVPVKSYSIEISKDRLFLANNTEGYDTPNVSSLAVSAISGEPTGSEKFVIKQVSRTLKLIDEIGDPPQPDKFYYYNSFAVEYDGDYYELYETRFNDVDNITLDIVSGVYYLKSPISGGFDFASLNSEVDQILTLSGFTSPYANNNGMYIIKSNAYQDATNNILEIYPLDITASIATSVNNINIATKLAKWKLGDNSTPALLGPIPASIDIDDLDPDSKFDLTGYNSFFSDLSSYTETLPENSGWTGIWIQNTDPTFTNTAYTTFLTGIPTSTSRTFKTGSRYSIGIQFYDFALRKCGVYTNPSLSVSTKNRAYDIDLLQTDIEWELDNASLNILDEIPSWAKYYSVVRTDNLDTRYFIQGRTSYISGTEAQLSYCEKDPDTGAFVPDPTKLTYDSKVAGIALDIESIINDGLGYIYEVKNQDLLYIVKDGAITGYSLRIIGQEGRYIIADPIDLNPGGSLPTADLSWDYEITRPYKPSKIEPFYEQEIYLINNWGTSTRNYSVISGKLLGDTFIDNNLEYMNLRKDFRNIWSRNLGRMCFIDPIGQVYRPNGVRWSNVFVPGSKVNGLSTFDAIDYKDLPVELGPINKLQTTSKAQSEGNVMLAIGQNYTASMYLGETSIVDNAGQSLLSTSGAVIGTVNVLKGRFGTTVPSSVVEYDGNVYWADVLNECIVRYSGNGLFAISDYGMRNYFRSYFKALKSSINEYDITQSPYMYGGYNPATDEYIISFIPVDESPEQYPDGSASRYSDIKMMYKTGTPAKSIAYSASQERWSSFYSHSGPYVYFGGKMYSFVKPNGWVSVLPPVYESGGLFVFDKDSTINSLGGAVKDSFITFPVNEAPNNIKIYQAISVEGDTAPTSTYVETFTPNNQVTNMVASDYVNREDMLYTEILRDRVSPNVCGTADQKMYKGDKIRGQHANISMVWENPTNFNIRFINVNIKDSIGHNKLSQ